MAQPNCVRAKGLEDKIQSATKEIGAPCAQPRVAANPLKRNPYE